MTTPPATAASGLDFDRVLPIFVLVFVDVLGLTVILPLLHLYAAAYGASPAQIGLVVAAFPLAQLIGVPVMGALSDRFGRKPLLLISQITTCLGFILLGLAQSIEVIILSRLIDGLFGANLATAQAALSDVTDDAQRVRGLGLTGAAFGLGFILGPTISIFALELTDNLAIPAFSAAAYSFMSILLTLFLFRETLPPERRGQATAALHRVLSPVVIGRVLLKPGLAVLLLLLFAQQLIFFGFESLMGLFTLSRLGLLGQANALIFLFIGALLVMVQVRFIGRWSQRWGERRLVYLALALLAGGLLLFALTPEQPHPFYVRRLTEFDLRQQVVSATQVILTDLTVPLPPDGQNGLMGVIWLLVALVPLALGAGLIRPCLNSLLTRRVSRDEYGTVLGVSASFVSAADGIAPLIGGLLFQQYGPTAPFLWGGVLMSALFLLSLVVVRPGAEAAQSSAD